MDYYTSYIALLAALLWGAATAAPTRRVRETRTLSAGGGETTTTPRWFRPCAGRRRADTTVGDLGSILLSSIATTPEFNASADYRQIMRHASVSRDITVRLMRNITQKRIKFDLEDDVADMRLSGLPVIPRRANLSLDVVVLLQQTYEWFMRFAVYLEAMAVDETIERTTHVVDFHREVRELEDNVVYWLLCKLQSTMTGHGVQPTLNVNKDILGGYHTTGSRAVRHVRGFLILRDLREAFRYVEEAFAVMLESATTDVETSESL